MPSTRFPRIARVRASSDFDRTFKHGRRVALPVLALHWRSDGGDPAGADALTKRPVAQPSSPRLGLAVSRKVDRHAVGRNRIKRVLRDCFRHHRTQLQAGDYVIVARPGAADCSGDQLRDAFLGLLRRAGALPALPAPGTMVGAVSNNTPSPDPASAHRVGGA